MLDFKQEIANAIANTIEVKVVDLIKYIEIPPDMQMGDYAFPCFRLAKQLKKSPIMIANEIKAKIDIDMTIIERVDISNGYLNFYVDKQRLICEVLTEIDKKQETYGSSNIGNNQNVIIDYSSPNIAKPFHIGHLRSTVIGAALCHIYDFIGYRTIGINHLGDWGTQFGKLIEGYKKWGNEYDINSNPIDVLTEIYVRINELCKQDENVLNVCRDNFKKLEEGNPYCKELWEKFKTLSLKEFNKIYDILGVAFDSYNGEAFYSDKMQEVQDILSKTGKLIESQGARIIDLEDKNMAPCIIGKTNGSTTYATRDLAAILYRVRTYDFVKSLYVTSYEQTLHFKQVFEVAKLLGIDKKYTDNLVHIPFGMVHLKTGKMSTREGNIIKLEDLLNEAVSRSEKIIEQKNPNLEDKKEVAKKVGVGAIIFNDLYNARIKDEIFDWDVLLNFNGETGPYVQYIYVRTKSVLEKAGYIPKLSDINFSYLLEMETINIIRLLYSFPDIIMSAADKNEPSIIARFLIELAQKFSNFYNEHHIISDDKEKESARLYLTYAVNTIIKTASKLLGMEMPNKM